MGTLLHPDKPKGASPVGATPAGRAPALPGLRARRDALEALGRLFEGAVPPAESLRTVADTVDKRLGPGLMTAAQSIERGQTLTDALRPTGLFTAGALGLVKAAEATGGLDRVFLELAADIDQLIKIRTQLVRGLIYPSTVLISTILLEPLPRILLMGGDYLHAVLGRLIAIVVIVWAAVALGPRLMKTDGVRRAFWKLPWPATIYVTRVRGRFARGLSRALQAGLGLGPALRVAADATGDPVALDRATALGSALPGTLTDALMAAKLVLADDRTLLVSGERAGALDRALTTIAARREAGVLTGLRALSMALALTVTLLAVGMSIKAVFSGQSAIMEQTDSLMKELEKELPPGFSLQ